MPCVKKFPCYAKRWHSQYKPGHGCEGSIYNITQVANLEKGQVNNLRYGGQRRVTQVTNLEKGQVVNLRYGLWDH
jgi:hypothetical protein